jgi:hypothetical protein
MPWRVFMQQPNEHEIRELREYVRIEMEKGVKWFNEQTVNEQSLKVYVSFKHDVECDCQSPEIRLERMMQSPESAYMVLKLAELALAQVTLAYYTKA